MSRFNDNNLENYQPVKIRIGEFYRQFPDGRIITEMVRADKFEAVFKTSLYRDFRDQLENIPMATGFAMELQNVEDPINDFCFFENAETSSIGRALRNLAIGNMEPSQEEMAKPKFLKSKSNWDFPVKKSVSEKPYNEKKYEKRDKSPEPQAIRVKGPTVSTDFTFKKINPKLSEDEIKNYQVPNGVHKGKYLDQIEYAELVEYTAFLQNSPRVGEWAKKLINVSTQFQSLNT